MLLSLELNLHISGQVTITPRLEKNNSKIGKKNTNTLLGWFTLVIVRSLLV
jgi:hypothetical protein